MNILQYLVVVTSLLHCGATTPGHFTKSSSPLLEHYCWDTCKTAECIPRCRPPADGSTVSATCNGHGTCNDNLKCSCMDGYTGHYCEQCAEGFASEFEDHANFLCVRGKCPKGTTGPKCSVCDYESGYYDVFLEDGTRECQNWTCGAYGYPIPYYVNGQAKGRAAKCECPPPYAYNEPTLTCDRCANASFSLPDCGVDHFKASAALEPCRPVAYMLPILLALGIVLLCILIAVAVFCCISHRKKQSNNPYTDDAPTDTKPQYNQL